MTWLCVTIWACTAFLFWGLFCLSESIDRIADAIKEKDWDEP